MQSRNSAPEQVPVERAGRKPVLPAAIFAGLALLEWGVLRVAGVAIGWGSAAAMPLASLLAAEVGRRAKQRGGFGSGKDSHQRPGPGAAG